MIPVGLLLGLMVLPFVWFRERVDPAVWNAPAGSAVQIVATVTEGIRPDCVYMNQGFGHISMGLQTAYNVGASDSDLHMTFTDPVSGGQALTQTFVTVEKA